MMPLNGMPVSLDVDTGAALTVINQLTRMSYRACVSHLSVTAIWETTEELHRTFYPCTWYSGGGSQIWE